MRLIYSVLALLFLLPVTTEARSYRVRLQSDQLCPDCGRLMSEHQQSFSTRRYSYYSVQQPVQILPQQSQSVQSYATPSDPAIVPTARRMKTKTKYKF